ncbi:hypothetical protein [Sulfurimonas sp.]|uniref:hypothetical protein n=1 Tax=Sulfurimonas sp. TaxID=2022749 RepID=UPI0025ED99AE|nr:hypothetical protein [Sulfurimonas sp.]MCK9454207.1 hypothetical protein [Sulfurimonas sp.]
MNNNPKERRRPENAALRREIDILLKEGSLFMKQNFQELDMLDYRYEIGEAVEELSLEEDIVYQLVEDYIIQILKSKIVFYEYIHELKKDELENRALDYTNIRNLAHKNLGVVRNLRIKDAEKLLKAIMYEEDLNYLRLYVKALEVTATKLNPLCAYETLKLIEVKNSL